MDATLSNIRTTLIIYTSPSKSILQKNMMKRSAKNAPFYYVYSRVIVRVSEIGSGLVHLFFDTAAADEVFL